MWALTKAFSLLDIIMLETCGKRGTLGNKLETHRGIRLYSPAKELLQVLSGGFL